MSSNFWSGRSVTEDDELYFIRLLDKVPTNIKWLSLDYILGKADDGTVKDSTTTSYKSEKEKFDKLFSKSYVSKLNETQNNVTTKVSVLPVPVLSKSDIPTFWEFPEWKKPTPFQLIPCSPTLTLSSIRDSLACEDGNFDSTVNNRGWYGVMF